MGEDTELMDEEEVMVKTTEILAYPMSTRIQHSTQELRKFTYRIRIQAAAGTAVDSGRFGRGAYHNY